MRAVVVSVLLCWMILPASGLAAGATELVAVHPNCGQQWLEHGLESALLSKSYVGAVNEITEGDRLQADPGRPASLGDVPGDLMAMQHWILWFNDYLGGILSYESRCCANRIIVFNSCSSASAIQLEGRNLGNPFSSDRSVRNYQAVFRHPEGPGHTYSFSGSTYRALDDVFADNPDQLFIVVTPPPLQEQSTTAASAAWMREFTDWLKNDWITEYRRLHPRLNNVAVFDWFDLLANPMDGTAAPNVLKVALGGGVAGSSQLNNSGYLASTQSFASGEDNFLDPVWSQFTKAVLYFPQFGSGGGFISEAVLSNPSSVLTLNGIIDFRDDRGEPLAVHFAPEAAGGEAPSDSFQVSGPFPFSIPPNGGLVLRTSPEGDLAVGSAIVTATSEVGGVVRFQIPDRGIAGVGASPPLSAFIVPVRRRAGGINTGLALVNTGGSPVELELELVGLDGAVVPGGSRTLEPLPAGGHRASFLHELLPAAETSDFTGNLIVRADGGQVAATALELGVSSGEFTTLPVVSLETQD